MADRDVVLAERYRDALVRIRTLTARRARKAWLDLGRWDEADVARFAAVAVPTVTAGQSRATALTDIYLARLLQVPPVGLTPQVGAAVRNGVSPADVYRRPFVQLWSGLKDGAQFADALSTAASRVDAMAQTDVQLAVTHSTREWLSDPPAGTPPIVGYSRTLTGESCGLCAVASTQVYKNEDLMPIHDRCDCGVAPIFGDTNAAKQINRQYLRQLKSQDTYTTDAAKLKHLRVDEDGNLLTQRVAVHEHGELGPVLSDAAHEFSGPAVAAA